MRISGLLWTVLLAASALAQESGLTVTSPTWGGLIIRFQAKVEPAGTAPQYLPGSVTPTAGGTQRFIRDAEHKRELGYDLRGKLEGESLRITLAPLTTQSLVRQAGWSFMSPPKLPAVPPMRAGDIARVDLLINHATGQKIVEYLTVERAALDPARIAKEPPRDFTVDDVELDVNGPRVWVNGKLMESSANFAGGIRAYTIWFFLPGEGTFVVALAPQAGHEFHKAGMMQGNTMTFRNGASEYRVECSSSIAPGSGIYNVYLHYEAGTHRNTEFSIGGTGKGGWFSRNE
jgi:hypothetical protein